MKLHVHHRTTYRYAEPALRLIQAFRLWPTPASSQLVRQWQVDVAGKRLQPTGMDGFGNLVATHGFDDPIDTVVIEVTGLVETRDVQGVHGDEGEWLPPEIYLRPTPLTEPDDAIKALVADLGPDEPVPALHALSARILSHVEYHSHRTDSGTTAAQALAQGAGVCQDHAHLMAACARLMGHPARYVSGYLCAGAEGQDAASHAWAEVFIDELGWVGFDPSNGISPDPHYVRIAIGRDYVDAAPVRGIRQGGIAETLEVTVSVSQTRTTSQTQNSQ
ncbi:transglutaminase family protein [Alkalisalibacterium limincola]|uniref:Transglutaminase family protein n=1 Tax=Alkalisalibacterium limincola TaxID=2699169 RepID=A0A5C8L0A8_9GAMM|nr:transglutaminase family protein [Alkalisalibacterium limincola]TXK65841.1 transglutaminase family protein [Alkalisalibacterium limincola]